MKKLTPDRNMATVGIEKHPARRAVLCDSLLVSKAENVKSNSTEVFCVIKTKNTDITIL